MAEAIDVHSSPFTKKEETRVNLADSGKGFVPLSKSKLSETMEMGYDLGPSPSDLYMLDASGLKLKWAKSPPRLALLPMMTHEDDLPEEQRKAGMIRELIVDG